MMYSIRRIGVSVKGQRARPQSPGAFRDGFKTEGSRLSPTPSLKTRDTNPATACRYQYTTPSGFVKRILCPRRDSNPDLQLGRPPLYPLSYGGIEIYTIDPPQKVPGK